MRIVQISDTHINHRGGVTNKNFETLSAFVNDVLRPDAVVNAGDVGEPGAAPWAGISVTSERVAGFRGAFGADHWIELHDEWALIGIDSEIMTSGLPEEAEQWE